MKKLFAAGLACLALAACYKSPNAWKSGDYGGAGKLTIAAGDSLGAPAEVVETRPGSFSFPSGSRVLMGEDTPLRGCNIDLDFGPGTEEKVELTNYNGAYRGDEKNDRGCIAFVGDQSFRVVISGGSIERDRAGETVLNVKFSRSESSSEPMFEYELRGHKTSWLR